MTERTSALVASSRQACLRPKQHITKALTLARHFLTISSTNVNPVLVWPTTTSNSNSMALTRSILSTNSSSSSNSNSDPNLQLWVAVRPLPTMTLVSSLVVSALPTAKVDLVSDLLALLRVLQVLVASLAVCWSPSPPGMDPRLMGRPPMGGPGFQQMPPHIAASLGLARGPMPPGMGNMPPMPPMGAPGPRGPNGGFPAFAPSLAVAHLRLVCHLNCTNN